MAFIPYNNMVLYHIITWYYGINHIYIFSFPDTNFNGFENSFKKTKKKHFIKLIKCRISGY